MKAETSFSLKDQLFNADKVAYLAGQFKRAYPSFKAAAFQNAVVEAFPSLELKQRIEHIAVTLKSYLPVDYSEALTIILEALPPELDPTLTDDDFGDFIITPLNHYVALYGCNEQNLERSLVALRTITKRFSAEDAIRFYINSFPAETLAFLMACSEDDNYHVRRLASEGTRAKLPWSQKLIIDYREPLPILDRLYSDRTRYVTRSVANHLNDVSKLDPDLVVSTLARWQASGLQDEKEMAFIMKHSLRTLVKQGNHDALALLGYGTKPVVSIDTFATSTPRVKVGDVMLFELSFRAEKDQKLTIDYLMEFASPTSKRGRKVFKLKQVDLAAGQVVTLRKKHPMRLMTTRRLYEGVHRVTLQMNGEVVAEFEFELFV